MLRSISEEVYRAKCLALRLSERNDYEDEEDMLADLDTLCDISMRLASLVSELSKKEV